VDLNGVNPKSQLVGERGDDDVDDTDAVLRDVLLLLPSSTTIVTDSFVSLPVVYGGGKPAPSNATLYVGGGLATSSVAVVSASSSSDLAPLLDAHRRSLSRMSPKR